jgi:hypothetical protein
VLAEIVVFSLALPAMLLPIIMTVGGMMGFMLTGVIREMEPPMNADKRRCGIGNALTQEWCWDMDVRRIGPRTWNSGAILC